MPETSADQLARATRAFLIAPAGCGKTEIIAKAVSAAAAGRSLVLTHTHAGVRALRARMRRLGVPDRRYRVETIAGWALRLARAFPQRSGLTNYEPTGKQWSEVYLQARDIVSSQLGR